MSEAQADYDGPLPGFEGPEKVLEIDFTPGQGPARGLREITRAQWDAILTDARCTILSTMSNDKIDSYVLSESSLFVYPLKMMLKTCGTTTLLMCLPRLLEATKVGVTRRTLTSVPQPLTSDQVPFFTCRLWVCPSSGSHTQERTSSSPMSRSSRTVTPEKRCVTGS